MRRTAVHFGTLFVLWVLVAQLNHAIAAEHVYVWVGGLFVVFGAVSQPLRTGLLASFLAGLLCDSVEPVRFGLHAVLFAVAHAVLFNLRDRIPREETVARVVIALLTNLALFLVFSFIEVAALPRPAAEWPRLIVDLICSQVFIALIGPWFFAFQQRSLEITRPLTERYGRAYE